MVSQPKIRADKIKSINNFRVVRILNVLKQNVQKNLILNRSVYNTC